MKLPSFFLAGQVSSLTSYFSLLFFMVFLPACLLVYQVFPRKWKKYFLLLASWGFYWLVSGTLIVFLVLSSLSMFFFGLVLEKMQQKMDAGLEGLSRQEKKEKKKPYLAKQRAVAILAAILHVGLLLVLKYSGFFATNVNSLLSVMGTGMSVPVPDFVKPLGISFYTLSALSYILDVYRGTIKADHNPLRLSLFLSFFPQIVEGPICRYRETAQQLWDAGPIQYDHFMKGLQRYLYGMMKKIVVADRLNTAVNIIYTNSTQFDGGVIALSAVAYTLQLYMDFSGSMDAVVGIAQMFGITMPENFKRPFFSKTISEFWQRWHITLGAFLRDYIFFPITTADGMKKLTKKARKKFGNHFGPVLTGSIALFFVWVCNGLWHGAGWHYIFFGMYHLVFILIGNFIMPATVWMNKHLVRPWQAWAYKIFRIVRTCILVCIGEMFFRADSLRIGLGMAKTMFTQFTLKSFNGQLLQTLQIDIHDVIIVLVTTAIVFVISVLNENGYEVREHLAVKKLPVRWAFYLGLVLYIIIFGAYGFGYLPVDPMYAQY